MSGMDPLREHLMKCVRSIATSRDSEPLAFVKEFLRQGEVYLEPYRALSGSVRIDAERRLTAMLVDVARHEFKLRSGFRRSPGVVDPVAYCIAGAVMGLVEWWIQQDIPISIEDLYAVFQRLVAPGFQDVTRRPELR